MVLVLASVSCHFLLAIFVEDLSKVLQVVAFSVVEHSLSLEVVAFVVPEHSDILQVVAFVVPEANIVAAFAVLVLKRPVFK